MIHISALVESGLYEAVFDFIWGLTTRGFLNDKNSHVII